MALAFDTTGVFGYDLIAATNSGGIWLIDAQGQATHLANVASVPTYLEGITVVPDDPARYGALAGTIVASAEQRGGIYAIDAQGHSTFYDLNIPDIETVNLVPGRCELLRGQPGLSHRPGQPRRATSLPSWGGPLRPDFGPDGAATSLVTEELHGNHLDGGDHSHDGSGLFRITWDAAAGMPTAPRRSSSPATRSRPRPMGARQFRRRPGSGPITPSSPGPPGWTIRARGCEGRPSSWGPR